MAVSATVQDSCIVSASPLAFGTYSGTAVAAQTNISVTCTNSISYVVSLDGGTTSGGTPTARLMTNGTVTLAYNLFQNLSHATVWGNTSGTNTEAGTGTGSAQSITVYGLIAAGQYPAAGNYGDTITVTVTYS